MALCHGINVTSVFVADYALVHLCRSLFTQQDTYNLIRIPISALYESDGATCQPVTHRRAVAPRASVFASYHRVCYLPPKLFSYNADPQCCSGHFEHYRLSFKSFPHSSRSNWCSYWKSDNFYPQFLPQYKTNTVSHQSRHVDHLGTHV